MTNEQREIHRKKRVLEHAERIGNVSQTCRYFGVVDDTVWIVLKEGLFKLDATKTDQQIRPEMEIEGIPYDDYNEWGITVEGLSGELVVGERYIWLKSRAAPGKKEKLHRVELTANVAVGIPKSQGKWVNSWGPIVAANGALWIGSWDRVYRVDPESHQALDEILLPRKTPRAYSKPSVGSGWISRGPEMGLRGSTPRPTKCKRSSGTKIWRPNSRM